MPTRFGILLLHFGPAATRERVIDFAPQVEAWGFDSVFARDHLTFQPHGFEEPSTTFFEPFTTLTAIAAITQRLMVGTAVTVPFRHPLVTSQLFGGLSAVAGPGRLIAGIGAGTPRKAFEATGTPYEARFQAVKELAEVLRLTWSRKNVSYRGDLYEFEGVTIDPHPPQDTPIWYGGSTPAAVRRALEYADGWFPGRCPLRIFDGYLAQLRKGAAAQGRGSSVGIIPLISLARNRQEGLAKINLAGVLEEARGHRVWTGPFSTADDLKGMLIAGSPDDCIRDIAEFIDRGVDQVVLDFRLRPKDFEQQAAWVARDVLPAVKEIAAAASMA